MIPHLKRILLLLCAAVLCPVRGGELKIAENGKSAYIIVVPDEKDDPGKRVSPAASLLQQALQETTGARLPVYFESRRPRNRKAVFLGRTKMLENLRLDRGRGDDWDCLMKVHDGHLFLAGTDRKTGVKNFRPGLLAGDGEIRGTLRAVTLFLREYAGTAFLLPGPDGVVFAKRAAVTVDEKLDRVERVTMRAYTRLCDHVYDCANNFFPFDKYKSYGGHSYYSAVPVSKYGKSHPEYFILKEGRRVPAFGPGNWQRNHLCISNPEVQELMLKEMEKQFDAGYDWVQLAQTDGCRECECASCRALGPTLGERLWRVHRLLAEKMLTRRPGKKVVILSYGPTGDPPEGFSSFPENVIIELSNSSPADLAGWRRFKVPLLAYVYNWGDYHTLGFLPKRTPDFVGRQIRALHESGVLGIYRCGFGENFGLEGPVYYVFGQMMKNPRASWQALADEFYRRAYGPCAPQMKRFFDELYRSLELYSHLPLWPGQRHWHNSSIMPRRPEIMIPAVFPAPALRRMRTALQQARRSAPRDDKGLQARLALVSREFEHLWSIAKIFSLYRSYMMADDSMILFDLMAAELRHFRAMVGSWYDASGKRRSFHRWPVVFANVSREKLLSGGGMSGVFREPFTWDLDGMRKRKIAFRARGAAEMKAGFVRSAAELEKIPLTQRLETTDGSALWNRSRFGAAYDRENLYFRFECDWAEAAEVPVKSLGPGGSAWDQESIDILICSSAGKDRYHHFIFNPADRSWYLARRGFVTDALDPAYGKYEKLDSPWSCGTRIDKKKGKWYAEVKIPFKTLGAKAPAGGDVWTLNVSRLNFSSPKRSQRSIWSQIAGEPAFKNPAAFGNMVFEGER